MPHHEFFSFFLIYVRSQTHREKDGGGGDEQQQQDKKICKSLKKVQSWPTTSLCCALLHSRSICIETTAKIREKVGPFLPTPPPNISGEKRKIYNQNIFNQSQRAYKNSRRGEPSSDNPNGHTPANLGNLGGKKKRKNKREK
jgi:hypothetical protein